MSEFLLHICEVQIFELPTNHCSLLISHSRARTVRATIVLGRNNKNNTLEMNDK